MQYRVETKNSEHLIEQFYHFFEDHGVIETLGAINFETKDTVNLQTQGL
jgi:glycine cleavage system regulatory protein